jgi:hypothetical protein
MVPLPPRHRPGRETRNLRPGARAGYRLAHRGKRSSRPCGLEFRIGTIVLPLECRRQGDRPCPAWAPRRNIGRRSAVSYGNRAALSVASYFPASYGVTTISDQSPSTLILILTLILTWGLGEAGRGCGETWNRAVFFGARGVPGSPTFLILILTCGVESCS